MPNAIFLKANEMKQRPSGTGTSITSSYKNKWDNGFLNGASTMQLQGANQALPRRTNKVTTNVLATRIPDVDGSQPTPVLPSWNRTYHFNSGRGIDAQRTNITFTPENAGLETHTGVVGPLINTAGNIPEPIPQLQTYQFNPMQTPTVVTGGESADQSIAMQRAESKRNMASIHRKRANIKKV